jgi:hypothetical protein
MDIGSIFLVLGLLVLVVLFISRPLFEKQSVLVSQTEHDLSAMLAERDRILTALQELDFDYSLNKIPEGEYPAQRTRLIQKGADVLRAIDELQAERSTEDTDGRLEAAIAARRIEGSPTDDLSRELVRSTSTGNPVNAAPDDDLEALIAIRRRTHNEKAGGFCPQCGGPVQKSDRFCPKCGSLLTP